MSSYNINKKYTIDKSKYLFPNKFTIYTLLKAIIINILIAFSLPYKYNYLTTRLNNGNFLVFSDNGAFIFDPTFTNSSQISGINYTSNYFNLAHFSEKDGGYILFITSKYHYILFSNGTLFNVISSPLNYGSCFRYSVIPYNHYNESYYYFVLFLYLYENHYYYYHFQKYVFFISNKTINQVSEGLFLQNIGVSYITCQLMKFNNTNVITCFFWTSIDSLYYINVKVYDPENNFEIIGKSNASSIYFNGIHNMKSTIMTVNERQKALFCSVVDPLDADYLFYYVGYDINSNTLYEKK